MRIALVADIHANRFALNAVLNHAKEQDVDLILFSGDLVGYYYQPKEVLDLLDEWSWFGVKGNHDELLGASDGYCKSLVPKYGSGILHAREQLSQEEKSRILSLPEKLDIHIDGLNFTICHGTTWDKDVYLYPDADKNMQQKMLMHAPNADVILFGHTHYPTNWQGLKRNPYQTVSIINPGSVGQVRDRKPGACYAIFDTAPRKALFYRISYDLKPLLDMCENFDPSVPFLAEVLTRNEKN